MRREGSGKSITRDWPLLLLVGGRKRGKEKNRSAAFRPPIW